MCGRFSAGFDYRGLKSLWGLYGEVSFAARYNVAPSQAVPVIIRNGDQNEAKTHELGLGPVLGTG